MEQLPTLAPQPMMVLPQQAQQQTIQMGTLQRKTSPKQKEMKNRINSAEL